MAAVKLVCLEWVGAGHEWFVPPRAVLTTVPWSEMLALS